MAGFGSGAYLGGGSVSIGGSVSGGTDGSVLFSQGGALTQDNSNFFWDNTNHQLLLGLGSASNPTHGFKGDGNTGMFSPGADRIQWTTGGMARWEINASGHLMGVTDNSFDIGADSATRPRSIYAATDVHSPVLRVKSGSSTVGLISIASSKLDFSAAAGIAFGFSYGCITAATSGANTFIALTPPANTNQTLSTEINGFSWATFTRQWATGALTTQREFVINAPTYAFVGASTITTAATLYVSGPPIAGTNATITTGHAAWFAGKVRIDSTTANGSVATAMSSLGPTGSHTTIQEWLTIDINGTLRYIPCF